MSSFSASGLTNKGRALQAKAQAGVQLVYTKAVAGDGTLGNQSIGPFTNVISPKQTYGLTRFKANGNMASIGFDLTNQEVTTGFYFREIGIFANDPDEGEILYWYANAGNTADYIPPGGGSDIIEKTFDVLVFVGTATNVSAVINDSLIYATVEALDDALDAAKAYTDSKFSQIIIQDASLTQKGVVQLTNLTNSTSQSLATTAKAVNDARVAAISAAATDATTKANTAETNTKNYVDAKPWQKIRITTDTGFAIDISNGNLNDVRPSGWYMGSNVANAPGTGWIYFEIIRHNDAYELQNAYDFYTNTYQQRRKQGGTWGPWSADVFQSGVDAKQGIVNAINAKGGSASTNDTWATLATKINAIQQGQYQRINYTTNQFNATIDVNGSSLGVHGPIFANIAAGTRVISIQAGRDDQVFIAAYYANFRVALVLVDIDGRLWSISEPSQVGGTRYSELHSAQIDIVAGVSKAQRLTESVTYYNYQSPKPTGFRSDAIMQLRLGVVQTFNETQQVNYTFGDLTILSL